MGFYDILIKYMYFFDIERRVLLMIELEQIKYDLPDLQSKLVEAGESL